MARPLKLNQVIAIEKGTKSRVYAKLTEDHKALQKDELFRGHAKTYKPKDDDPTSPTGEQLPDDRRNVQARVDAIVKATTEGLNEWLSVAAARDWGNTLAKADVVVDGKVFVKDCPVTFLLVLEKQLSDLHTFVKKLPTLDASEKWSYDRNQALYATEPAGTARTKKIVRPMVLYEATDKHPAQVKEITEDVFAGTWTTIKYSAALPVQAVNEMIKRVEALQDAVKVARERANEQDVAIDASFAKGLLDHVFEPAFQV
jgi:hypothetical protein